MTDNKSAPTLDELNDKIHDLNYIAESGSSSGHTMVQPDAERGKELARKIKENIEAYQNEIATTSRPHHQAS